jgi:hypothetical protein
MYIALLAYSAYLLNSTQFVIKLRAARREGSTDSSHGPSASRRASESAA